jgi:sugar/nucleoside kinase (ribokinase family)
MAVVPGNAMGLFVGMTTLDLIYLAPQLPRSDEKIVAIDSTTAAGGPATNAAVAFQSLGNRAKLLSAIGQHPSTTMIRADLGDLALWDLAPDRLESPPISSIIVTQSTGDRAVISVNATRFQADVADIPANILQDVAIVLIDGHQMTVGAAIAAQAKTLSIPVAIDGGSVLPHVDYAVCSANFHPPGMTKPDAVFDFLAGFGISAMAITQGSEPILYRDHGQSGAIPVPQIQSVDTLGAGDFFHGAFCHFVLQMPFPEALGQAAAVAGRSCESFGSRSWLRGNPGIHNSKIILREI